MLYCQFGRKINKKYAFCQIFMQKSVIYLQNANYTLQKVIRGFEIIRAEIKVQKMGNCT